MATEKEQYQEVLTTLTNCDHNHPTTLAFLAMTQHQYIKAGCKPHLEDQPKATLARLRELMKRPERAKDEEAQGFLREAEALIEGNSPVP